MSYDFKTLMPFFEAAAQHRFVLHRCGLCGRYYWPASNCIEHGDKAMTWTEASGRGTLYTYTILYRTLHEGFAEELPYNVAVVETEEGPLVFSNIVDCPNEELRVGMPLTVVFEDVRPGLSIPKFKPVLGRE